MKKESYCATLREQKTRGCIRARLRQITGWLRTMHAGGEKHLEALYDDSVLANKEMRSLTPSPRDHYVSLARDGHTFVNWSELSEHRLVSLRRARRCSDEKIAEAVTLRLSPARENDGDERDEEERRALPRDARKGDEQAKVQGTTRVACYIDRT